MKTKMIILLLCVGSCLIQAHTVRAQADESEYLDIFGRECYLSAQLMSLDVAEQTDDVTLDELKVLIGDDRESIDTIQKAQLAWQSMGRGLLRHRSVRSTHGQSLIRSQIVYLDAKAYLVTIQLHIRRTRNILSWCDKKGSYHYEGVSYERWKSKLDLYQLNLSAAQTSYGVAKREFEQVNEEYKAYLQSIVSLGTKN